MNTYILSCCSTIDLTEQWTKDREVYPCYFHLRLGEQEYLDDFAKSIATDEIYRRMLAGENSQTSQVNIEEYEQHFRKFLDAGKDILHVTLSSGISGTFNSAKIAAEDLREEYPDRKIYIVDSLGASSGYGLLMDALCDLRDQGMDIDALYHWAEEHKHMVQSWFFTSDLTFFIRGGRISKAAGFRGKVLNICPLLTIAADGTLKPMEKVRGKKPVIHKTEAKMEELAENGLAYSGKCFISHSECPEDAQHLADLITSRFPNLNGKVQIYPIGPTIGCHTGPGTVALFFFGKERR
jgi:DegV family protein with EDD domain